MSHAFFCFLFCFLPMIFDRRQGVIVSSLNLVAAAGGLIAGTVSDTLGRKRSIAAACLVFITGSIIKIAAQGFG